MDLLALQLLRKPRFNGFNARRHALPGATADVTLTATSGNTLLAGGGVPTLDEALATLDAEKLFLERLDGGIPRTRDANATASTPIADATEAVVMMYLWLVAASDLPAGSDFADERARLTALFPGISGTGGGLEKLRLYLSTLIIALMVARKDKPTIAGLCTFVLVIDLFDPAFLPDAELRTASGGTLVWNALHRRDFVLPAFLFIPKDGPAELPGARLVRDATVADLFVVRSEWRCYHPAEIASITNTLANSRFEVERKVRHDEETTNTTTTETTQTQSQSQEDRTQTELSRELQRNTSVQAQVNGSVSVSGQYGIVHFGANASAGFSSSLAENMQQASKVTRDMISRAASTVESRVREERTQRILTRTKDRTLHAINNEGQPNTNGIYRWVDRVDRYQVFRFPNRLQLEFQLPEPATFLRWRRGPGRAADPQVVAAPPAFEVDASEITRAGYGALALKYLASNVPAPPDEFVSVTDAMQAEFAGTAFGDDEQLNPPHQMAMKVITLPADYVAISASFEGEAVPIRATWRTEAIRWLGDNMDQEKWWVTGFHAIAVSVLVGGVEKKFKTTSEVVPVQDYSVQVNGTLGDRDRSRILYQRAFLNFGSESIKLSPPAEKTLTVACLCDGAAAVHVGVTVSCKLTDEAFSNWRNTVYDALLNAWQSWQQAYRTSLLQQQAIGGPDGWDATSPERNAAIIRDELKRQVITWLLNNSAFAGRDAMIDRSNQNTWDATDLTLALKYAPEIQFFEQAFEWGNLIYVCYPYYWAGNERERERWVKLADIDTADPFLADFLRAGSARVIVPARPGMEDAVKYWLAYGELNLTGPLPVPGEIGYLSIAQELRDMTAQLEGGEPGASWEARMGTTLLWLEKENVLPSNNDGRLGLPPNEPDPLYC